MAIVFQSAVLSFDTTQRHTKTSELKFCFHQQKQLFTCVTKVIALPDRPARAVLPTL